MNRFNFPSLNFKNIEISEESAINIRLAEFITTSIPDDERGMKSTVREIGKIPKMSTLAIGAMINRGISQMPEHQVFLNIGVWNGFTFLSGVVDNANKKCIGVDNFSQFGADDIPMFGEPREAFYVRFNKYKSPNHYFYDMDYIEYFSNVHKEHIGFYIYDGEHSYENQLKGLQLAEPFLASGWIIVVDDTNWSEPRQATIDFISNSSQEYRIILDKSELRSSPYSMEWNHDSPKSGLGRKKQNFYKTAGKSP